MEFVADYGLPFILFMFGLAIGSFLNVVIYRLPREESLVVPGSHCPSCNASLRWYELFPVVSYLWQRGRCRHCSAPIAWRYPAVELVVGLSFAGLLLALGTWDWRWLVLAVLVTILVAITGIDMDHLIIPNRLLLLALPFCLSGPWFWAWPSLPAAPEFWSAALGGVTGAGLLGGVFVASRGGMGLGDVKFMAVFGLFLSPLWTVWSLTIGSLFGSLWGLVGMVGGRYGRKSEIPFGPFLALGWIVVVLLRLFGFSPDVVSLLIR
ncbi:prepilin peptidase [Heliophilum fasciatum]|uniref:Leader peptidase (Prepilin peptidase)/N-methyltransferase/leader peptidase (Prepilin peptidase)/N-methyltransferase n=1 Tax=Heliophilum fasciatum TaxID=35700 RepID=A0A4R2RUQ5_9FIRM|nr:A24 family peptidase [Heliophilum fasciatum]MCW2277287.1 prepilin signal peptidase PulO-like enzyme (type II secretory pathway) [Heliophilum fasciatum]TCP67124.1 leader peptidase (prepilin peptidase)/N-methyltransferase/leader peptidase (prepilin peptidase)/N-methyltransferase [Heliophilum fasciatum]